MSVPSGDHAGPSSHSALWVSWVGFEPSAFMTQISRSPSGLPPLRLASLSKAIFVPSSDQAGPESKDPTTSNSVVSPVPSTLSVWIERSVSPVGEVVLAKSTLLMSGERLGYHWCFSVGSYRRTGFSPSGPICQMFDTRGALQRNRIALLSGNHVGWLDACPAGVNVNRRWSVPEADIRATSKFTVGVSGLRIRYAMSRPSGDQSLCASSSGLSVSRRRSVTSGFIEKMSPSSPCGSVRKLENAIRPLKTSACADVAETAATHSRDATAAR